MNIHPIISDSRIHKNQNISVKNSDSIVMRLNTNDSTMPLNSFNKYLVNFNGLNRTLSKRVYSTAEAIKEESLKNIRSNGIVGNLPSEWIKKIPKKDRETKIKKLYAAFKEAIKDFRENHDPKETANKLAIALHNANLIGGHDRLTMKYIEKGYYGRVYHLQGISNDKYVIKIFSSTEPLDDLIENRNGNYAELNRAAFWQKNAGKNTQRVRFYFGDVDAGYMVNKYICGKTPNFKKYVPTKMLGLLDNERDHAANIIKGYNVDWGGLEILPGQEVLAQNKTARYIYKKIYRQPKEKVIQEFEKIFNQNKYKKNKDMNMALISLLDLVPDKILLAKKLYYLSPIDVAEYFPILIKNADEELKETFTNEFPNLAHKFITI